MNFEERDQEEGQGEEEGAQNEEEAPQEQEQGEEEEGGAPSYRHAITAEVEFKDNLVNFF